MARSGRTGAGGGDRDGRGETDGGGDAGGRGERHGAGEPGRTREPGWGRRGQVFENGNNEVASRGWALWESTYGIPGTWTGGLRPTVRTAPSPLRRGDTGWWWRGRARGPTGP